MSARLGPPGLLRNLSDPDGRGPAKQGRRRQPHPTVTFRVDGLVSEAAPEDYDALILPGGAVNPDNLRQDAAVVTFVRDFVNSRKPDELPAFCARIVEQFAMTAQNGHADGS